MVHLRRNRALLLSMCLFFSACTFAIRISVMGSLGEGITFVPSDPAPLLEAVRLERLVVARVDAPHGEEVVWEVTGEGRVASLHYGVVPNGFEERAEAVPLQAGSTYRVYAVASGGWIRGGGSADCEFSLATDGKVQSGTGCHGRD